MKNLDALKQAIKAVQIGSQLPPNQLVLRRSLAYWCVVVATESLSSIDALSSIDQGAGDG
jgi:hypothetical protein